MKGVAFSFLAAQRHNRLECSERHIQKGCILLTCEEKLSFYNCFKDDDNLKRSVVVG
jgi:hypothetical protein